MPDFWQFPTVSMGLGPILAIYQARFMKYLEHRGLAETKGRKVWCFVGDGEMDEPESLGAIGLAAREKLDNLIFVVNCNLQRLDGPVRGNGKIIQELEGTFRGAGWNVIKVIWGDRWDPLLAKDKKGLLLERMEKAVDGDYQNYKVRGGAYTRAALLRHAPRAARAGREPDRRRHLAAEPRRPRSEQDLRRVSRRGEAHRPAHRDPRQDREGLRHGRGRRGQELHAPAEEARRGGAAEVPRPLPHPDPRREDRGGARSTSRPRTAPRCSTCTSGGKALGGYLPARSSAAPKLAVPDLSIFDSLLKGSGDRDMSTTMAFVRMLAALTRDKKLGKYVVPIVPDEARTFGMEGLFRQLGIYASEGQLYEPVDSRHDRLLPRGQERPDPAGGHQRGRRALVVDRGGHVVREPRPADDPVLHLLLDVRLPARGRPDLGRRRLAHARLPARRHRGPHHARRRGPPAPGRPQPRDGGDGAELPRLRSRLRLRARA